MGNRFPMECPTGALTIAQLLLIIALVGVIAVGALFLTGFTVGRATPAPSPSNIVPQAEPELAEPMKYPAPAPDASH